MQYCLCQDFYRVGICWCWICFWNIDINLPKFWSQWPAFLIYEFTIVGYSYKLLGIISFFRDKLPRVVIFQFIWERYIPSFYLIYLLHLLQLDITTTSQVRCGEVLFTEISQGIGMEFVTTLLLCLIHEIRPSMVLLIWPDIWMLFLIDFFDFAVWTCIYLRTPMGQNPLWHL